MACFTELVQSTYVVFDCMIFHGQYSRAVCNQERVMMSHVRQVACNELKMNIKKWHHFCLILLSLLKHSNSCIENQRSQSQFIVVIYADRANSTGILRLLEIISFRYEQNQQYVPQAVFIHPVVGLLRFGRVHTS